MKIQFIIYADAKCLLEKISSCDNVPNKPFTKQTKQLYSVWLFIIPQYSFDSNKSKHDFYRGCLDASGN